MTGLTLLDNFLKMPIDQMLSVVLVNFGWIPIAITFLWGSIELWVFYLKKQWGKQFKKVLLAIDVPRGNEQTMEAVENMMTYFAGAHVTFNLIETYWEGRYQLSFSFEIVSINGYTQFIIRTPEIYRDIVESAVYSQYPDAEITEVDDYTEGMPDHFPDDEWDMYGGEFIEQKHWAYPIKTYKEFLATSGKPDNIFKDPMASLMDFCSSLKKGEQLWYQIIVYPEGFDWPKECEKEVKKILKEKTSSGGKGLFGMVFGEVGGIIAETARQIADMFFGWGEASPEKQEDALKMMNLKPLEKKRVEAITKKGSKLGFSCKQRFIYIAKKEVMNKNKGAGGMIGYMKQFIDLDLNNFKPDMKKTITTADYFFADSRKNKKKNKLMFGYKGRDGTVGRTRYILNIEELATIWHFPVETAVKAPLMQKAAGRKSEPPMTLPVKDSNISEDSRLGWEYGEENIFTLEDEKTEAPKVVEPIDLRNGLNDRPEHANSSDDDIKTVDAPPDNLPFV